MEPTDAVILENWFPQETDVITRLGHALHCNTGEGAHNVETVAEYKAGTTRKLLVGCHGRLINATTATPSTVGTGFTSNRWRYVNFSEKIFLVNGLDAPQDWDGTTLTSTAWVGSGLTNGNLSDVAVVHQRLWFVEKDTLNAWHADLKAITSTLTKFPLKYTGSFGGALRSIGVLSIDGGDGADDLTVFLLSSGEVIVYQGTDPTDATNFSRVGTFSIGPPISGAPLLQFGNELLAITKSAYTPVSRVMPFGQSQGKELDLSKKISGEVSRVIKSYGGNTGWQAVFFPEGNKLLVNVPRSTAAFDQHVMNLSTRAWCKFTGWNFPSFGRFNDLLYAGGTDGKVYQVDVGYSDNNDAIVPDVQSAWNYYGSTQQQKNFTMARVILAGITDPGATMSFGVDFVIPVPSAAVSTQAVEEGGVWDVAIWDVDEWAGATRAIQGWQGITGQGYAGAMRLRMSLTAQQVAWRAGNVIFKPAGLV